LQDIEYWLALHRVNGVGPALYARLLDRFGSPREVFRGSSRRELRELGLPAQSMDQIGRFSDLQASLAGDLSWLEQPDHSVLTILDSNYPVLLKEISQPPPLLFIKGNPDVLSKLQIAMVGSRNPTRTGRDTATAFARSLSDAGLVVTSGMAAGIDGASHLGALNGATPTVAVLGTGVDQVYPQQHRKLAGQIAAKGALVSEFPLGAHADARNFPRRNRIISGLALGVLVVEANIKSGSLITARCAVEQNREVFAIPGSIHSPLSRGCHLLLREGAKLVEKMDDVLEEVGSLAQYQLLNGEPADRTAEPAGSNQENNLSSLEQKVLLQMDSRPVSIDAMVAMSGIQAEQLAATLILLELKNRVRMEAGGYVLIPELLRMDA
jgi:DNA processing protein